MPDLMTDENYRLVAKTIPDLGQDRLAARRARHDTARRRVITIGPALAAVSFALAQAAGDAYALLLCTAVGLLAATGLGYAALWAARPRHDQSSKWYPVQVAREGVKAVGGAGQLPAALHAQPAYASDSFEKYVLAVLDGYVDAARLTPAQRNVFDTLAADSVSTYDELIAISRALA